MLLWCGDVEQRDPRPSVVLLEPKADVTTLAVPTVNASSPSYFVSFYFRLRGERDRSNCVMYKNLTKKILFAGRLLPCTRVFEQLGNIFAFLLSCAARERILFTRLIKQP